MRTLLSFALLLGFGVCRAQDEPRTELGEVRLNVTNALIQEVKGGRTLSMRLKWDYLPESKHFKARRTEIFELSGPAGEALTADYELNNEDFRTPEKLKGWFERLPLTKRNLLARALSLGQATPGSSLNQALELGNSYFNRPLLQQLGWSENGQTTSVDWFSYITSRRDFYAMRWLFAETRGAGAVVDFDPAPRGKNPLLLYKGLKWRIKVFPTAFHQENPLFRFAVSVETGDIKRTFRTGTDGPVDGGELVAKVGLLKERKSGASTFLEMIPISIGSSGVPFTTSPLDGSEDLEEIESNLSPSVGSTTFTSLTGMSASGLFAPLFENSSEASLFYGTLLGAGRGATTYGLNYIFTDRTDGNLGFLYGFVPEKDDSLFLGPSIMLGPFTAAIGGRIFNDEQENVATALAGVLSIDLARAFGKGPKPTPIKPEMHNPRSEVWQDVDGLYKDSILAVGWFLAPLSQGLGNRVTVRQVYDSTGDVPDEPYVESVPILNRESSQERDLQLLMLPFGTYSFEAPVDGMVTITSGTLDTFEEIPADEYAAQHFVTLTASNLVRVSKTFVRLRGYRVAFEIDGAAGGLPLTLVRASGPEGSFQPVTKRVMNGSEVWLPAGAYTLRGPEGTRLKMGEAEPAEAVEIVVADPLGNDPPGLNTTQKQRVTVTSQVTSSDRFP